MCGKHSIVAAFIRFQISLPTQALFVNFLDLIQGELMCIVSETSETKRNKAVLKNNNKRIQG